jgi:hypothetical protein
MQRCTVHLYLETALHVSGDTSIHHQERIQLYLQHLVFVTPLLLSAAIMEELELVLEVIQSKELNKIHQVRTVCGSRYDISKTKKQNCLRP